MQAVAVVKEVEEIAPAEISFEIPRPLMGPKLIAPVVADAELKVPPVFVNFPTLST